MLNLRNRSFLKEIDFEPRELRHLLQLSEALKIAKYAGTEAKRLDGKEIALIFEKTSTRTRSAFEVGAFDQGAHVTYLDPSGSQLGHKESVADTARVLGRMYDAIEFRGTRQDDVEVLAQYAGVPVYNGLTDEWHPTQMLADFLTMHEASGKPYDALAYAFVGDCRFNMGRSLLVTGALLGADVRLAGPAALAPPADVVATAREIAEGTGASITITDDAAEAVSGVDFIHTDVWVSMGESKDVWTERVDQLTPYQVNSALLEASGNRKVKFMHCLPAFHDPNTVVGREMMEHTGMSEGLEVTGEVFESPASIVFDQAENRLHTIKALLVATLGELTPVRVLVALGGNALLKRGEPMTVDVQRANIRVAARALSPIAQRHELVLSHGNGPQVGLLALQAAAYPDVEAYPLDVLGAQTEGMIGYLVEQELGNLLPADVPFATILTMVEVDPEDPAFQHPTKFVGPIYDETQAEALAAEKGWTFAADGDHLRRVVPSPEPKRIFEIRPIRWLLDRGVLVICAGGGGIPTSRVPGEERTLTGVEAVIDKDLASELLAREVEADLFLMATDVDGVYDGWGTPEQRRLERVTVAELRSRDFAAGSMGPKVEAAVRFVESTGRRAAIGSLADIDAIVGGDAGTTVVPDE